MLEVFGYLTIIQNSGITNEYNACRKKAVLIDLSALRKFEILGPDAEELLNYTLNKKY